jgi:hypothetical protein
MKAYRKAYRKAFPLSADRVLLKARGTLEISSCLAAYLESWSEFLPVDEHRRRYRRHLEDMIFLDDEFNREWEQLMAVGALVSAPDLRRELTRSGPASVARLEMLAMPSAQRPGLARRGLRSIRSHAETWGREPHILLSDDSRDPEVSKAYADMVEEENRGKGGRIHLLGPVEKANLRRLLSQKSGISPECVDFAMADPLSTGFTCGANRNWTLLATAGSPFLSADDDVLFSFRKPHRPQPSIFFQIDARPDSHRMHADDGAIDNLPGILDWNVFEQVERWLGQSVDFLPGEEVVWGGVCPDFLLGRDLPKPSVRAAFHGLAGVPLIQNPYHFLAMKPPGLHDLLRFPKLESALLGCRVQVSAAGPTLTRNSTFPGYCMALDNSSCLPPFLPVLHAEDGVQSAVWGAAWPEALQIQLPASVLHAPPLPPGGSNKTPPLFQMGHLLMESFTLTKSVILSIAGNLGRLHADPWVRMNFLGRSLEDLGHMPLKDFERLCILQEESLIADLTQKLVANKNEFGHEFPEFETLVDRFLESLYRNRNQKNAWLPADLAKIYGPEAGWERYQKILGLYGRLIQDWPAIWGTVRDARRSQGMDHPGLALD